MAKITIKPNPRAQAIMDDLENYLEFCRNYGYRYNEADLYNMRVYSVQQYRKAETGKNFKDQWLEDARKFGCNI